MAQRIKISTVDLHKMVEEKIAKREADIATARDEFEQKQAAYIQRAIEVMEEQLVQLRAGVEPETSWSRQGESIYIHIDLEYPSHPKVEQDEKLHRMRRHESLLKLSVDPTILVDPDGEFGMYL